MDSTRKYKAQRIRSRRRYYVPRDGGNADGRYNSAEYRRIRDDLLRERSVCEIRTHCDGAPALCVYHIKPIRYKGDPRLTDKRNMKPSCYSCNNAEAHSRRRLKANETK